MNTNIIISSTKEEVDFIDEKLVEYNESNVSFEARVPFNKINKHIKDENGQIIAGINCIDYSWKCLYIDVLWVSQDYRKRGLGSKLLTEIETIARKYEIQLIHLDTFDFQALDFYLKNGYEVYGVLDNCPQNHKRYYLKKVIE